jgi:Alginate export
VNVSSHLKKLIGHVSLKKHLFLGLLVWLLFAVHLSAQDSAVQYIEYPQILGKVQPLRLSDLPKWVTFDGQLRGRTEDQTSDDYISGNNQLYELTRIYGGMTIQPSEFLTGYIQFIDTHALGLPLKYTLANMRDTFDDRQAYLNFHVKQYSIIAGRQELKYGDERLVGISDWTNNSRTWDGFLGRVGDKNRLDLFATSVVLVHPTSLDTHGAGLSFFGAVGTTRGWVRHSMIQPFVYVKALPRVESRQGTFGTETEVTSGAEAAGQYSKGFDFDGLIAFQRGSYSNDSIDSSAGYIKAGYTAQRLFLKPRFLGEYDYASGNTRQNLKEVNTFDQQYPSNHNAFGLTDLFGFQNIEEERMNLDLTPAKHVTLLMQQEWLQVASRFDNIYSGSAGNVVTAPTAGFQSGDIGREFDASGKWVIHDYLVMNVGVGHFSPGTVMRENAHGAPLTLAYFGLTYRFKISR